MSVLHLSAPAPVTDLHGRTVVVVHAHPDDEAIFTGATVRRLADRGARVVLVTATLGELGEPRLPLPRGRTLGQVRQAELERSAALLGVARLVLLGRRDSGLGEPDDPRALVRGDLSALARRIADLAVQESAEAVVGYDADGVYGHPDHVAVHLLARHAATLAGATSYDATVDREHLHFADRHLLDDADGRTGRPRYGRVTAEIGVAVAATPQELAVKREALLAHPSQIGEDMLAARFAETYELEWYLRRGAPALLDELGNAHALAG